MTGYGGNGGNNNKQVQPTFGVSFGLPQPSNGYPINPYNSNPLHNPYGPALNGGGLNLGLVSVNPLLAVQVTKNDYGDKIVKPFVNLHVTPNEHVVNKLGHLFHEKKEYLLNKHEHYHHYPLYNNYPPKPYRPVGPPLGHPSFAYPPIGHLPINHDPIDYHQGYGITKPSIYSPHYPYTRHNQYNAHETTLGNEDYYDEDDSNNDDSSQYNPYNNFGFERSLNNSVNNKGLAYATRYAYSRSLNVPSNSGVNREKQAIRFPENRKKREVSVDISNTEIQEVINRRFRLNSTNLFFFTYT